MQEISDKIGENQFATITADCIDCKEEFKLFLERTSETDISIKNGAIGKRKDMFICKCASCFKENEDFGSKTEVYSRVVGYLRPISNWNPAKQDEFAMRKPFTIEG